LGSTILTRQPRHTRGDPQRAPQLVLYYSSGSFAPSGPLHCAPKSSNYYFRPTQLPIFHITWNPPNGWTPDLSNISPTLHLQLTPPVNYAEPQTPNVIWDTDLHR